MFIITGYKNALHAANHYQEVNKKMTQDLIRKMIALKPNEYSAFAAKNHMTADALLDAKREAIISGEWDKVLKEVQEQHLNEKKWRR
jgi:hypothetical protein